MHLMNTKKIEQLTMELLIALGEDPQREGLKKTPQRVAKMYEEITSGYRGSLRKVVNQAVFSQKVHNMIVVKNIELYSLCEHHMLPFFGKCHVGYIAKNKVIGLSKVARIVDLYAKRLQLQERLTEEIAQALFDAVNPAGVGVIIEAQHLCMMMRGVEKQNSTMTTSSLLGTFRETIATREEFLSIVGKQ